MSRRSIDDLLERARRRLERLTPQQALAALGEGAVLVDTRSPDERSEHGAIPGALCHPLSVVLWRLDPDTAPAAGRLPLDTRLIVICRHGYSSSLTAATLQELGFERATDVIGGAEAWRDAGLRTEPA